MARKQSGYIWRVGESWHGRWREDVLEDGRVVRKQRSAKLADVSDRYRTKSDVRPLLAEKLRPINEGRQRPESTLHVSEFVEDFYLPFVRENYKPSTSVGYQKIWNKHLAPRLSKIALRDFRTVDAATLLAEIHRQHRLGRTMLKHIKAFLSGVFTYAKNQGVLDGLNPVRDAMIPKKAAHPEETYAASLEEVLAIMDVLEKAGRQKARAAVALVFFAGLRPGEARGARWEDYDGKRLFVRRSIWRIWTTSPKTESSAKPVPVIEPLGTILAELRKADGNPTSGPILCGPSGKPLDLDNLAERVVKPTLRQCAVCKKLESKHKDARHDFQLDASLPGWHGWYSLRRGVGTAVADLSNSLAAKGLLRHSSVSTTERHYIKDVPESTLQAMKQLEALCNECANQGQVKPN
jgi:integrase